MHLTLFISKYVAFDESAYKTALKCYAGWVLEADALPVKCMCRETYMDVQSSIHAKGPLRGALFWQWSSDSQRTSSRAVLSSDSTFGCSIYLCCPRMTACMHPVLAPACMACPSD